ncbi:hypothetical protein [Longimicrobium terrae]|uniref:Uncharacterized protein n=1 Tax=Longimicrobium terrae TaxID=1639882 RepID=A0A841GY90_9BACT|nr:hypothetical protein [Longimicrobium terrae]MBB4636318.1 hypothetical protein [Longimicrobium terrae]MBB6070714.1 hypothetical protein [Longimicrobium terrae]NNC29694.1 hypothetical protein [Longimicrobium terrae]
MNTPDPHEDELPPALLNALRGLPRERQPGRLLEERTVRALRENGLVQAAAPRGIRRLPMAWIGGAVAASLALFASGVAVGQWMGGRATAQVVSAMEARNSQQAAMLVQQTGTAYVQALRHFAAMDSAGAADPQGREVAAHMLRAAAGQMVRIAPNDAVAGAVMASNPRTDTAAAHRAKQQVLWF